MCRTSAMLTYPSKERCLKRDSLGSTAIKPSGVMFEKERSRRVDSSSERISRALSSKIPYT